MIGCLKSPFLLGKSTSSMAIFNSFLYVYKRVTTIIFSNHVRSPGLSSAFVLGDLQLIEHVTLVAHLAAQPKI